MAKNMAFKHPIASLLEQAQRRPKAPYLRQAKGESWVDYSFQEVVSKARDLSNALRAFGIKKGDKVALISKNCPEWFIVDLGIWGAGAVSVPMYPTLSGEIIDKIVEHSDAKLFFVGKMDQWGKQLGQIKNKVPMVSFEGHPQDACQDYREFLSSNTGFDEPLYVSGAADLATIIYTSGTTGDPKGVMHDFSTFSFAGQQAVAMLGLGPDDRGFSYLPLAHVAERCLLQSTSFYAGNTVSFPESLKSFAANLKSTQPTFFLAVPRIWSKFKEQVEAKLGKGRIDAFRRNALGRFVLRNLIPKALGLGKARHCLTGAAPTPLEMLEWYKDVGISIEEAYGSTENFAYSHMNLNCESAFGGIGRALNGVEERLAPESNELLTRSPTNMKGYYKHDEATNNAFDQDEFYCTGDVAERLDDGSLKIKGRAKDTFKTAKGEFIDPNKLEDIIRKTLDVDFAVVSGLGLPQPIAMVALPSEQHADDALLKQFEENFSQVNQSCMSHEAISRIVVVEESFFSEDSGLVTPTLKVKRIQVNEHIQDLLPDWMDTKSKVVRHRH